MTSGEILEQTQFTPSIKSSIPLTVPAMSSEAVNTTPNQSVQSETEQQIVHVSQPSETDPEHRTAESESIYAESTTSTKASSSSSRFASLSKLPLLSRIGSSSAGSSTSSDTTLRTQSSKSRADGKKGGLLGVVLRKSKAQGDAKGKSKTQAPEHEEEPSDSAGGKKSAVRDPVKTVPSGKPPAVTFGDLAYRYGSPGGSGSRRL
ncbi:hypothetical protein M408DRAFT_193015 [Serendipita vermifera MAFF 305830]|uniref:Uncharacterized protein n=1 Tax=Serendipita vermifera MAFF 305830 TaxID=933852 RepID=A0A0C2XB40_SERVB|nr:hypothetical protein M408DRAFT_193015 [Serendipita vermifera MAFF 305830]